MLLVFNQHLEFLAVQSDHSPCSCPETIGYVNAMTGNVLIKWKNMKLGNRQLQVDEDGNSICCHKSTTKVGCTGWPFQCPLLQNVDHNLKLMTFAVIHGQKPTGSAQNV